MAQENVSSTVYSGGCACVAIRYKCTAPPEFSLLCQCRQCQRISGAGHAAQFAVLAERIVLTGQIHHFDLIADSGNKVKSGFCATCGSPVLKLSSGYPQFVFVHAATLDEPARFAPQMLVWNAAAQPRDHADPKLTRR